jgi:hypothetical protein
MVGGSATPRHEIPFQRVEGMIVVKVRELHDAGLLVLAIQSLKVTAQQ